MSQFGEARRLTAILMADVVGYSRLMAGDESGTLTSIKAIQRELIGPKTAAYQGRLVKLIGDGALMEFASVVDAVRFAVDVQQGLADRNEKIPEDRRIIYRIGINIGDIIVEGDDIYGDGVNIAARLESLADPGGICVSQNVYDQVKAKVAVDFEDLGAQEVKNIPELLQVFRVRLHRPDRVLDAAPAITAEWRSRWLLVAGSLLVLAITAGVTLWQRPWEPREEPASAANMVFPLPDKPSIAVLPFANMSDDPSQEYFADGMAEDLITDLSKISGLFVISRNSAFTYKGRAVKVQQVAEELSVRYVLEGSVRRAGDVVRINAQLIDAMTGGHLWAERYDGTLANVFGLQDKVTKRIVAALALTLTPQDVQRMSGRGTDNIAAHDAYLLGLSFYYRRTPSGFVVARSHFEKAIDLDPDYAAAHAAIAKIYSQVHDISYSRALKINFRDAESKARASLAKVQSQTTTDVHVVRSWLALNKFQHERAIAEAEKAIELSPNDVDALEALARAKIFAGQAKAGISLAERAMRQNPTLLARPFMLMGLAEFVLGNLEKAVEHIERALELGSEEINYAGIQAAAYALLGRSEKAREALAMFWKGFMQQSDLARSMWSFPFSDRNALERQAEGLELAGVKVWFSRDDGGYLPLHESNRLSGDEIRSLFLGKKIEGKQFWIPIPWQRLGAADGPVTYTGFPIQPDVPQNAVGVSRIEDDLLCEHWSELPIPLEYCSTIFRLPEGKARTRWGDYVMVTDTGPQPFKVVE